MILIKALPNMITLLRIMLTCLLNLYIIQHFGEIVVPSVMTLIIFLTDYLDGKIARFFENTSRLGAVLDVLADLFYMFVTYVVLCYYNMIPFWFLLIVLLKFIEFIVTSLMVRKLDNRKSIFVFDFIGRTAAVFFYIIPILTYISSQISLSMFLFIRHITIYIVTLLAFASSIYRVYNCIVERVQAIREEFF